MEFGRRSPHSSGSHPTKGHILHMPKRTWLHIKQLQTSHSRMYTSHFNSATKLLSLSKFILQHCFSANKDIYSTSCVFPTEICFLLQHTIQQLCVHSLLIVLVLVNSYFQDIFIISWGPLSKSQQQGKPRQREGKKEKKLQGNTCFFFGYNRSQSFGESQISWISTAPMFCLNIIFKFFFFYSW